MSSVTVRFNFDQILADIVQEEITVKTFSGLTGPPGPPGSGGLSTVAVAFTSVIKADKKYFSTDTNKHTQSGAINFTVDNAGAIIDGGHVIEIVGDGSTCSFTVDFGLVNTSLNLVFNKVTLVSGTNYLFVFFWTGAKMNVMIGELQSSLQQLLAPTVSNAVWATTTSATVTITDANTDPNEVNTQVEWSLKDAGSWTLGDTVAQDGTSATITGLSDVNSYDFRAKAIGSGYPDLDSNYSNTFNLAIPASIILVQDNFNDNSIDAAIWNEDTDANGTTAETNQELQLTSSGASSASFGLKTDLGYTSANDLLIFQAKITHPDTEDISMTIGISAFPYDANNRVQFARKVAAPITDYRWIIKDGGVNEVNEDTGITTGKDVRIKYVPSTGAITGEYWNGSAWASIGATGNVDLGSDISAFIITGSNGSVATPIIVDDFFISEDNYSTHYPT